MKLMKKHAVDVVIIVAWAVIVTYIAIQHKLELAVSVSSLPVAFLATRWYGAVAAGKAVREYEGKKATSARINALQSLLNEVERIRKLVRHNSQLASQVRAQPIARMPVTAFETAFVSGAGLEFSPELWDAVTDYLTEANSINLFADIYVAGTPSGESVASHRMMEAVENTKEVCVKNLPPILNRMSDALRHELEAAIDKSH
jgi:hypothetical protein